MEQHIQQDIDQFNDLPVSKRLQPIRDKAHQPRPGLSFSELERLGSQRIWAPILDLPRPREGDDVYPPVHDDWAGKFGI